jgi:cell division protein FtsL
MKKTSLLLTFCLVLSVGLTVARIVLSAAFSTTGLDLNQIQAQTSSIQKENMNLQEEVLTKAALTTVDQKATADGFQENTTKTQLVLTSPKSVPVAYRQ